VTKADYTSVAKVLCKPSVYMGFLFFECYRL